MLARHNASNLRIGSVALRSRPELNPSLHVVEALDKQLGAFGDGGKDVEFLLDLSFNAKTEGYIRFVRALDRHRLMWVEIDSFDPRPLALMRRSIGTPLAGCESLFGRRQLKDFFENYATSVATIDVPWNGILVDIFLTPHFSSLARAI
jgi:L-alanine-DL-glutamate epimerase-like enolase superfamily enzyme